MRRLSALVLAVAATGALIACGGGKGPDPFIDRDSAISLTGSTAPIETVANQAARSAAIVERADSLVVSTTYAETDDARIPRFHIVADCSGTRCTLQEPTTRFSQTITLDDLLDAESGMVRSRAVLTRNGITLQEGRGGTGGPNYRVYGAWMDHGIFAVSTWGTTMPDADGTDIAIAARVAQAASDLSGSRPSTRATWRGVMVGTPARGGSRDNILQGDATLTYHLASQTLDANFTNIVDLDRNAAHTVQDARFDDVAVAEDGTYRAGGVGNLIQGGFAGPGHLETGGVFEQRGIVGAFGAVRQ